jgi:U32 family peptidase
MVCRRHGLHVACSRMKTGSEDTLAAGAVRSGLVPRAPAPELLAPAGDWECARAAVENGADGIYFGLERFNARMRAHNFTVADLPKLMEYLHRRGVRGYVTFNTLVFAGEITEAEDFLRAIIAAGVDAAIVQDAGLARLLRALSPDFPMHASTQMTITSAAGVDFARALGCQRVILARECPLAEIAKIQQALAAGPAPTPELEVFVHGALCVAYSGQCLTSEALGGRSANRGECAQACRLPFELVSDGQTVPLGDRRYLLSPQDLAGLEVLPELVRLGIASVKIEGRLKAPEYVANITRIYRQALDRITGARADARDAKAGAGDRYDMEMAFSRGLHTGWFHGINNQKLVHARFGKKRGVYLGQVSRIQGETVFLRLEAPLKPGDGVVLDAGRPDQDEEGGRVYAVWKAVQEKRQRPGGSRPGCGAASEEMAVTFGNKDLDFRRIHVGDRVWKTSDPELDRRIRQTFSSQQPHFQRPIFMEAHGSAGRPLTLIAQDDEGHLARLESAMSLALAEKQPFTAERLRDQLGRLGGTPFTLGGLKVCLEGDVILPVSELNRLRRTAVARLEELRAQPMRWTLNPRPHVGARTLLSAHPPGSPTLADKSVRAPSAAAELVVLVRNLEQFEAALRSGIQTLYCDFEDPKKYREAVTRFRERRETAAHHTAPSAILVAPPRITKMGEEWMLEQVRSSEADGYLVRNYDQIRFFAESRRLGDFSLNVANPLAAEHFIHECGLERVTASYDLNAEQLEELLRAAPPAWFEITIHQHIPMFHMEHCLFCAFLANGTDYTNCGRPCEKHRVELRDRVGAEHPVKADAACRNTVFHGRAQTGAEYVSQFLALGARRFRLEFLEEPAERVTQTIGMYRRLLNGEITGAQLWRELKLINRLGVTRGPLETAHPKLPRFGEIEW